MPLDTTLLNLDRAPTILEMRAFFKKHDWSAAKITEPKSRSTEDHTAISRIGQIMDVAFEQEARKRGLPAWSGYLDHTVYMNGEKYQDNPLIALRNSVEDLVSDGVRMILTGPDEIIEGIFSQFDFDDPDLDKKADNFLHTAVGTMLDVMQYDQLAGIVQNLSAAEDFNPHIKPNFRAQDHNKKAVDLKVFLEEIRKCIDITELTPTLVNTLIKKIDVFNSVVGPDGKKHVPITIHFRAAGIITIPDEKEIVAAMEEIRNNPSNVA